MKWPLALFLAATLAACAHRVGAGSADARERAQLWHDAHIALYQEDFPRAEALFRQLAVEHPETTDGREALFYVGGIHLDPRNPEWNTERAETVLRQYLLQDTVGTLINRRPEATTLFELARQLNLPPEARVSGLQPGRPAPDDDDPPRPATPATQLSDLQEENERLRGELAQRDDQVRRQREELERIRRALAPRTPPE